MTLPVVAFPDSELAAVTVLRAGLPDGVHVGTEWPDGFETMLNPGVVSVTRGGGGTLQQFVTEQATLDIDVLAATKQTAHALAQQTRALVHAAAGSTVAGARIYGVSDTSLVWLPYEAAPGTDTMPRYVLVMDWTVRPA